MIENESTDNRNQSEGGETVSDSRLNDALQAMILSASGWRKVFAPGGDHSGETVPDSTDRLLAVGMGLVWGQWIAGESGAAAEHAETAGAESDRRGSDPLVLVATDTRPTGPVLAEMLIRGLEHSGVRPLYIGAASAPEAMALSAREDRIAGFAYISASHNPLGHNGVKFGRSGGVLGGADAKELIEDYRRLIGTPGIAARLSAISAVRQESQSVGSDRIDGRRTAERKGGDSGAAPLPRRPDPEAKNRSLRLYREFLEEIAGGPGTDAERRDTLYALRSALSDQPVRIIADLNGSARCVSADRDYLNGLGARLETFNDRAGEIAHAILPEGESLEPCRLALEKAHVEDPGALIGYVPDNDGDRGNLVVWDERIGGARRLEAQEVFALSTLAEFSCAAWSRTDGDAVKSALVVNGPTSHRVREIAAAFGAEVFEAEVGEANVVNRAAELREAGYRVRLLGEGSNGGTITHPARVRDPLNTVTALLKLLRLPGDADRFPPFRDWCRRIGRPEAWSPGFGPADILVTLPAFTTTATSEERALASVATRDHGALKTAWEGIFAEQWLLHKDRLAEEYGFRDWYEVNNEGTVSRRGVGEERRTGSCSGGLKVVFLNEDGLDAGFIWMRGSGTEPVFRVMAEIRGTRPEAEKKLALWQKAMVASADRAVRGEHPGKSDIPEPF